MKKVLKEIFFTAYFFLLVIVIADILIFIEELFLFDMRPEIICVDMMRSLKLPLAITLTFCVHFAIKKLYKRLFENTDISLN